MKNTIIVLVLTFFYTKINCHPIEVTGKNITYYKLTPNEGSGTYNFNYGTHDGSERSERGFIKREPGSDKPLLVVTGSFKYPDAKEVFYIADEQGYRIVSKEEIDDLHGKLPNEILPSTVASKSSVTTISSLVVSSSDSIESRNKPQSLTEIPQSLSRPQSSLTPQSSLRSQSSIARPLSLGKSESSSGRSESSLRKPESSRRFQNPPRKAKTSTNNENVQIPVTESKVIKLNVIQPIPIKPVTCPPGKCSGPRQSKIFKIKPIKFG